MKQFMTVLTALALVALVGCQSPVLSGKMTAGTGAASGDPVGGLTVRLATTPADVAASRTGARAITGVTKLVVSLESAQYASQVASASEVAGTFTLSFATVKPGLWTVKASLLDASDVEKYFGQVDTTVQPGVANSVSLAVSATGNIGLTITENTTLSMVSIPGGSFSNGTATMTVSDFQMSQTEVTQAQYQAVTGINPSNFTTDPNLPVETVTWYDAVEFCNKLSTLEGLTPVYTITDRTPAVGYPISGATVVPDYTVNGYRLPSESEWEYACRAGTTTTYYWGNSIFNSYLWYYENGGGTTHPVKTKLPNSWGLYDMSGNVAEWCGDWNAPYQTGVTSDFFGPNTGTYRVVRGGNFTNKTTSSSSYTYLQSATRGYGYSDSTTGFRVVKRAALDSADVTALVASTKAALEIGYAAGDSVSSVTKNLALPTVGPQGTVINWASSDTAIISVAGVVSLPASTSSITMTATLTVGTASDTKDFMLSVVGKFDLARTDLSLGFSAGDSVTSVSSKVTLPNSGLHGTSITWASSDAAKIALDGTLGGQNGDVVTLTATLTLGALTDTKSFNLTLVYPIGKAGPAGGLVFYKKADASGGWQFLEAAPSNQSSQTRWTNGSHLMVAGARGTAIGTGQANTAAIVAAQGVGSYAATLCDDLVVGGYSDWFLPSRDELNAMYYNLHAKGLGSFLGRFYFYWSSTQESNYGYALNQDFYNGGQVASDPSVSSFVNTYVYNYCVRAARAF